MSYLAGPAILHKDGRPEVSRTGVDRILPSRPVRGSWRSPRRALRGPRILENTGFFFFLKSFLYPSTSLVNAILEGGLSVGIYCKIAFRNGWVGWLTVRSLFFFHHFGLRGGGSCYNIGWLDLGHLATPFVYYLHIICIYSHRYLTDIQCCVMTFVRRVMQTQCSQRGRPLVGHRPGQGGPPQI